MALRAAIGPGNSTLLLQSGRTYALGGAQLTIPSGATVTIATVGHGPLAVIDGERRSNLFDVYGVLRLIGLNLTRGELSGSGGVGGAAIWAGGGSSLYVTGSVISDCTASSSGAHVSATPQAHRRAPRPPHPPRALLGRHASPVSATRWLTHASLHGVGRARALSTRRRVVARYTQAVRTSS
jgi:hypothetical protein